MNTEEKVVVKFNRSAQLRQYLFNMSSIPEVLHEFIKDGVLDLTPISVVSILSGDNVHHLVVKALRGTSSSAVILSWVNQGKVQAILIPEGFSLEPLGIQQAQNEQEAYPSEEEWRELASAFRRWRRRFFWERLWSILRS